jgi:hypothetical protein
MATPRLTGTVNLSEAIEVVLGIWDITFVFNDWTSTFLATQIAAEDRIYLDTSAWQAGTICRYKILSITGADDMTGVVTCRVQFDDSGEVIGPENALGVPGAIGRATEHKGYNILPAPGSQFLSDMFAVLPRNEDFVARVDMIPDTGGATGATGPAGATGVSGVGITGATGADLTPLVYDASYKAFVIE